MKLNDWIVANINNPEFTNADFKTISGLNLENTQFLSKDEYKNSKFIQDSPMFKNKVTGLFDEKLFDLFYNYQALKFDEFVEDDSIYEREYNFWDPRATDQSKIKNPNFSFVNISNPDRTSFGTYGRNESGPRKLSKSELAQTLPIYNFEKGEFINKTPNDYALFKSPSNYIKKLGTSLVLATYDEDGYHIDPITGIKFPHRKGDPKLNENGTYYAETLSGRSPRNKQFITNKDLITVDGTTINKYDFFDSDDIKKDPGKVISDVVASVLPMVVLGPYKWIYNAGIIVKELFKATPMLTLMITWSGKDSKLANNMSAIGQSWSRGTSEFAREHMFSFENIGSLVADVALQWGQQKTLAEGISRLRMRNALLQADGIAMAKAEYFANHLENTRKVMKQELSASEFLRLYGGEDIKALLESGKWAETVAGKAALGKYLPAIEKQIEKSTQLGQDMALAYMAIISNTDVYDTAIEHGATNREAALISLASTAAMFGVDKYLHLGEMFYDGQEAALKRELNTVLGNAAKEIVDGLKSTGGTVAKNATRKSAQKIISSMNSKVLKALPKFVEKAGDRSLGFLGKAFGEGLEEFTEEFTTDLTKTLFEIAGDYGLISTNELGSWDNAGPRYAMNFLGGFIGGGMFYGVEAITNPKTYLEKIDLNKILYLVLLDKTKQILDLLDKKFKQKNKMFGSYDLSYDKDNENHFITADENHKSQAEVVYNQVRNAIVELDLIMHNHHLKASEDELFERLVLSESNLLGLKALLGDMSYFTYYQQDFQSLVKDITNLQTQLNKITVDNPNKETQDKIDALNQQLQAKILIKDEFISGKRSLDYLSKLLWLVDVNASSPFVTLNKDQYSVQKFGRLYNDLLEPEKKVIDSSYDSTKVRENVDEAWNNYKVFRDRISKSIEELKVEDLNTLVTYLENERNFFSENEGYFNLKSQKAGIAFKSYIKEKLPAYTGVYGVFDEETDEDFATRTAPKLETETEEQYNERVVTPHVMALILQDQINKLNEFIILLKGKKIDFETRRRLSLIIGTRVKDISTFNLDNFFKSLKFNKGVNIVDETKSEIRRRILKDLVYNFATDPKNINFQKQLTEFYQDPKTGKFVDVELHDKIKGYVIEKLKNYRDELLYDLNGELAADLMPLSKFIEDEYIPENLREQVKTLLDTAPEKMAGIEDTQSLYENLSELNDNDQFNYEELRDNIIEDFYDMLSSISKNQVLQLLNEIDQLVSKDVNINPSLFVLKEIATKLDLLNEFEDIEKTLNDIYDIYLNVKNPAEFELTENQLQALQNASKLLDAAKSVIYSATTEESLSNPIGQNKQINRIIKEKSELFSDVQPLLELDEQTGNALYYELDRYKDEIDRWILESNANKANRIQLINIQNNNLNATLLQFFEVLGNLDEIDLIDEEIDTDDVSLKNVIDVANLIKTNFDLYITERINKGETRKDVIKDIFEKLITSLNLDLTEIARQKVSRLDEAVGYTSLTSYDKFTFMSAFLLGDFKQFHVNMRENIKTSDKAPLFALLFVQFLVDTYLDNVEDFNIIFEIIEPSLNIPIIANTVMMTGSGGTGKTTVIAKAEMKKAALIAIAGPSESQTLNLLSLVPEGKIKEGLVFNDINSLLSYFIKEDHLTNINSVLEKTSFDEKNEYFDSFVNTLYDKTNGLRVKDKEKIKEIFKSLSKEKIPDLLVFDEATYLAHPLSEILGIAAKEFGFKILLIGDEAQNNYKLGMDREVGFAFRTPRLDLSMRVENINQYKNQNQLNNIINGKLLPNNASSEDIKSDLSKIRLKYYINEDDFSGALITKELENSVVNSIKKQLTNEKDRVIFVGDKTSSNYLKLKQELGDKVEILNETKVQGNEAKYIVADVTWKPLMDKNTSGYTYLLRLNTLLTRAKRGIVFIDNGLSDSIGNSEISTINTDIKSLDIDLTNTLKEQYLANTDFLASETVTEENTSQEEKEEKLEETESISETETREQLEKAFDGTNPAVYSEDKRKREEETKDINEEPIDLNREISQIRTYSNINRLGITRIDEHLATDVYPRYTWIYNSADPKEDVGIFMPHHNVKSGKEKKKIVTKYLKFKRFLVFYYHETTEDGKKRYIGKINNDLKRTWFNTTDINEIYKILESAKFFIEARTLDKEGRDSFVGLTTANSKESSGSTIGSTININNNEYFVSNFVTLVVNGEELKITLGLAAHPVTWRDNIRDKSKIAEAISELTGEDVESVATKLEELVSQYENELSKLVAEGGLREINRILFTDNSEKYTLDDPIRFGTFFENDYDESDARLCADTVSPIRVITQDQLPGLTKEQTRKWMGRAIVYWTSDPLANPESLESNFVDLEKANEKIKDPNLRSHRIRWQVLYNAGVDFMSLLDKDWAKIFSERSGHDSFPFVASILGGRMYRCIWNFRARLYNFLQSYKNTFNESERAEIIDILKIQSKLYLESQSLVSSKIREAERKFSGNELIEERKKIRKENELLIESKLKEELKDRYSLWESVLKFNRTLDNQEFRVGLDYTGNGMNIGRLLNSEQVGLGKTAYGIYIHPELAEYYLGVLNTLFTEVFDKIIEDSDQLSIGDQINLNDTRDEKGNREWGQHSSELLVVDENGKVYSLPVSKESGTMSMIPIMVKEILQRLNTYRNSAGDFELKTNQGKYKIKITNPDSKSEYDINPFLLFKDLGVKENSTYTGVKEFGMTVVEDGGVGITRDDRITNLFRVIFHGLLRLNNENDFTGSEERATVADFKYGICVDPAIYVSDSSETNSKTALSSTDKAFFLIPSIFGSPIGYFSISPKIDEEIKTQPEEVNAEETFAPEVEIDESVLKANNYLTSINLELTSSSIDGINESLETELINGNGLIEDNWDKFPIRFTDDGQPITLLDLLNQNVKSFISYNSGIFTYEGKDGKNYTVNLNDYFERGKVTINETLEASVDQINSIRESSDEDRQKLFISFINLVDKLQKDKHNLRKYYRITNLDVDNSTVEDMANSISETLNNENIPDEVKLDLISLRDEMNNFLINEDTSEHCAKG